MNCKIVTGVVALLAILGSGGTAADELGGVTVSAKQPVRSNIDARAVGACGDAVVSRLLPSYTAPVRVVVPVSDASQGHAFIVNIAAPRLDVGVTARYIRTGALLATASCTVSRDGEIEAMTIKPVNSTLLAGLKPSDIRFAMLIR